MPFCQAQVEGDSVAGLWGAGVVVFVVSSPIPKGGGKVLMAGLAREWEMSRELLEVWKGKALGEAQTVPLGWEVGRRSNLEA